MNRKYQKINNDLIEIIIFITRAKHNYMANTINSVETTISDYMYQNVWVCLCLLCGCLFCAYALIILARAVCFTTQRLKLKRCCSVSKCVSGPAHGISNYCFVCYMIPLPVYCRESDAISKSFLWPRPVPFPGMRCETKLTLHVRFEFDAPQPFLFINK